MRDKMGLLPKGCRPQVYDYTVAVLTVKHIFTTAIITVQSTQRSAYAMAITRRGNHTLVRGSPIVTTFYNYSVIHIVAGRLINATWSLPSVNRHKVAAGFLFPQGQKQGYESDKMIACQLLQMQ